MLKDIYHGSPVIIRKPIFGYGKTANDYGQGFYCTEIEEMAKEWSTGEDHDGFANHYRIETKGPANREYFDSRKKRQPGQLYITEILDNSIGPTHERLLAALA